MEPINVYPCQNIIGEGPLWNVKEQAIYWVDIDGKKIQRYYPESSKYESFDVPKKVCLMAFREKSGMTVIKADLSIRGVVKALKNGECVVMLPDVNAGNDGVFVDFMH